MASVMTSVDGMVEGGFSGFRLRGADVVGWRGMKIGMIMNDDDDGE